LPSALHYFFPKVSSLLPPTQKKKIAVIFESLNATRLAIKVPTVGKIPNHPRSSQSSRQLPKVI